MVAETPKRVERLGQHARLPVEVVRFGWRDTRRRLTALLPDPELRTDDAGEPYLTDEGHLILDCPIPAGTDPGALGLSLEQEPGVVEHGLFLGVVERALLGRPDGGVDVLEASRLAAAPHSSPAPTAAVPTRRRSPGGRTSRRTSPAKLSAVAR